jgi:hypothetical protein
LEKKGLYNRLVNQQKLEARFVQNRGLRPVALRGAVL